MRQIKKWNTADLDIRSSQGWGFHMISTVIPRSISESWSMTSSKKHTNPFSKFSKISLVFFPFLWPKCKMILLVFYIVQAVMKLTRSLMSILHRKNILSQTLLKWAAMGRQKPFSQLVIQCIGHHMIWVTMQVILCYCKSLLIRFLLIRSTMLALGTSIFTPL